MAVLLSGRYKVVRNKIEIYARTLLYGLFYDMKRHPALIPFSKQHHQMLVVSQVLKSDVPDYKGMPSGLKEKNIFLKEKFKEVIVPNINMHRKQLYPALLKGNFSNVELIEKIKEQEDLILLVYKELIIGNVLQESQLNDLGYAIDSMIRVKERKLYELIQSESEINLDDLEIKS
ncbi:hypothetical protein JKA74_15450 [Marivirga sp. S37H4]|uniref:Uncharacterized protein n=1 Tax=Marivirga aurantiaca TaxID=2802615 RepID=A0A935CA79_9BACT|nr:hypothetical protein [Marivirga aurantiaca]MBK6266440.1 hypothetical protein [Marivirga aurantiaca]